MFLSNLFRQECFGIYGIPGEASLSIASASLEPLIKERSGRDVRQKRLSKRAPGAARHALYLAVLIASRD